MTKDGARPLLIGILAVACLGGALLLRARPASRGGAAPASGRDGAASPVGRARPAGADAGAAPAARSVVLPSRSEVAALEEARLMARLREVAGNDPALAVVLAREGNARFAGSADAAERTSILIHALANLGRAMEARGEAENMVNGYPDSSWVREIERFTGAHRHRNVRVNDAGVLEYGP